MSLSKSQLSSDGYINRKLTAQLKMPSDTTYKEAGKLIADQIGFERIQCFQPVAPGRYQLTFTSMKHLIEAAECGIKLGSELFEITPMYSPEKNILIRNAPFEMTNELLSASLSCYGKVSEIVYEKDLEFGVYNGNRRCKILADRDIPNFIRIGRYNIMITYSGVKPLCRKCHLDSHLAMDCETPFCKKCFSYGHLYDQCLKNRNLERVQKVTIDIDIQDNMNNNEQLPPSDEDVTNESNEIFKPTNEVATTSSASDEFPPLFSDIVQRPTNPTSRPTSPQKSPVQKEKKEKATILQNPLQNVQTSMKKKKTNQTVGGRMLNYGSPVKTRNKKQEKTVNEEHSSSEDST